MGATHGLSGYKRKVDTMKRLVIVVFLIISACIPIYSNGEQKMTNLIESAPYSDNKMGKRKLVDAKHLLMMQAALKPGQMVPQHNANSNVHIIVLDGQVTINLSGNVINARKGDLVPVALNTPMNIKNDSTENATFLIVKTPNPSEMS
jgi:quercetin dioxygenase-like cupin family protein